MTSRILVLIDKPHWSYHAIANGFMKHAPSDLHFEIQAVKDRYNEIEAMHSEYDWVFAMGWQFVLEKTTHGLLKKRTVFERRLPKIPGEKVITGIHSHRAWDNYASQPDQLPSPPDELIQALGQFRRVGAVSKRLHRLFEKAGLKNLVLTENGVDTELFRPLEPISLDGPLRIGFSGSTKHDKHDNLKGVSEFILPLADIPGVELKIIGAGSTLLPQEEMPAYYNSIDLYLCASTSEGFSQSILEVSACGRPVLTTRVGGCEDLIEEGHNGAFIERDLEKIRSKVIDLASNRTRLQEMGTHNRKVVERNYSWKKQSSAWFDLFR